MALEMPQYAAWLAGGVLGLTLSGCGGAPAKVNFDNPKPVASPLDGAWSQVAATEDMVYVAGQRGRLPDGSQVPLDDDGTKRVRQAFQNMKMLAEAKGAELTSCVRLVVYVTDIKYRAVVNAVQNELWGANPKPPRTILVVNGLNQDDIVEIDGDFARTGR